MSQNNKIFWKTAVYPLSNFKNEFNALSSDAQNVLDRLIHELEILRDPEDHSASRDCPGIQGFNHAIKFVVNDSITLIVAIDRIMEDTPFEDNTITLFSCSE